jgi:hypothetical protein
MGGDGATNQNSGTTNSTPPGGGGAGKYIFENPTGTPTLTRAAVDGSIGKVLVIWTNPTTPLYIAGHLPDNDNMTLYTLHAEALANNIPLFIRGNQPLSNSITLYIGDLGNRIENGMTLYLKNPGSDSGIPLVIWGIGYGLNPDSLLNGVPIYNSIYLYIQGQGTSSAVPLYLNPIGLPVEDMPLYINSSQSANSGIPLYIKPYGINPYSLELYTHGF